MADVSTAKYFMVGAYVRVTVAVASAGTQVLPVTNIASVQCINLIKN